MTMEAILAVASTLRRIDSTKSWVLVDTPSIDLLR